VDHVNKPCILKIQQLVLLVTHLVKIVQEMLIHVYLVIVVSSSLETLVLNAYLVVNNAKILQLVPLAKLVSI
jgi:hypothetical protein